MTNEELEFLISQHVDGNLPPAVQAALEMRLAQDSDARALLQEYRALDIALKAMPMPVIHWDALAEHISATVDAHEAQIAQAYRMPAWVRVAVVPLALAASLFIVAGVGIEIYRSHQAATGWETNKSGAGSTVASSSVVDLPTDKVNGPVVQFVAIGPAVTQSGQPVPIETTEEDAARTSHIAIASGVVPVHDTASYSSFDME